MIERPVIGVLQYVLTETDPFFAEENREEPLSPYTVALSLWNWFLFGIPKDENEEIVESWEGVTAHAYGSSGLAILGVIIGTVIGHVTASARTELIGIAITVFAMVLVAGASFLLESVTGSIRRIKRKPRKTRL